MKQKKRKKLKIEYVILLILVGILGLILVLGLVQMLRSNDTSDDAFSYSDQPTDAIYYESAWYVPRENMESMLILGIDKMEGTSEKRENSEQADFLALFVFDHDNESYRIVHLNRDTI